MARADKTFKLFAMAGLFLFLMLNIAYAIPQYFNPNPPHASNTVIDVGQISALSTNIVSTFSSSWLASWKYTPPVPSNIMAGNTILFQVNSLSGQAPNGNVLSLEINAISETDLELTFNGIGGNDQTLDLISPSPSTPTSNTIFGSWSFIGNAIGLTSAGIFSGSNALTSSDNIQIDPAVTYQEQTPSSPQEFPFVPTGSNGLVSVIGSGGTNSYTYNWFNGTVLGGYDNISLTLIPPFNMPKPPKQGKFPSPMFSYQNPLSNNVITPYIWNGIGMNAISVSNTANILAGNETSLPAFLPNVAYIASTISSAFTIPQPTGALTPENVNTNKLLYNLDAYELYQSNTLNATTFYTDTNALARSDLSSNVVGINVIITNLGINQNYVNQHVPFGIAIIGVAATPSAPDSLAHKLAFATFNSLPSSLLSSSIAISQMFSAANFSGKTIDPLFDNITLITLLGPPLPAPGISISIYDSANIMTPALTDTNNNLLLATYSYNGPLLLYNVTNTIYLGSISALTNNVLYTGENGIPVNVILTANTAVDSTIPDNSVTYFTFNVPEFANGASSPNSYLYINLTNSSQLLSYPLYNLLNLYNNNPQNNVFYTGPGVTPRRLPSGGSTARGSAVGPVTPVSLLYYMATNEVAYSSNPSFQSNSFIFNALASNSGPNLFKITVGDQGSGHTPEQNTGTIDTISVPGVSTVQTAITNTSLYVGQTTLISIFLSGGQPPYTGYWDILPPSITSSLNSTIMLTLPTNEITLLANVTSANTIIFTPTLGLNNSVAGGRNNSLVLSISDNKAYLAFPSFGGQAGTTKLLAVGLPSNTVYGLWGADATVSGSDPGTTFTVLQTPTPPQSPGGSVSEDETASVSDNIGNNPSDAPVVKTFEVSQSGAVSETSYMQNQLPASITVTRSSGDYMKFLFACSFNSNGTAYSYQNDVYGLGEGDIPCNTNYTVYGGTYEIIYSGTKPPAATTANQTVKRTNIMNATIQVSVYKNSIQYVNFTSDGVFIAVKGNTIIEKHVNLTVRNLTSSINVPVPRHLSKLSIFNISATNSTLNITMKYSCSIPQDSVAPYIYSNGTWSPITPFVLNKSSCDVTFSVPGDPVIALFEKNNTAATTSTTTSIETTTKETTAQPAPQYPTSANASPQTTIIPPETPARQTQNGNLLIYAAVAVVIIIAVLYVAVKRRRMAGRRKAV